MSPPSKMASVRLLIGIGLLLAIISQSGAVKCYKCVGPAECQGQIPVEECTGYGSGQDICAYSQLTHPNHTGRVEQRYCTVFLQDSSTGCQKLSDGSGRECTCSGDLCNTEEIWKQKDVGPQGPFLASSSVHFATPLLIILGSFITLLIGGGGDLWN